MQGGLVDELPLPASILSHLNLVNNIHLKGDKVMIKRFPRTKAEYIKYHRILWQAIIDYIKKNGIEFGLINIKRNCFNRIFELKKYIHSYCFGCEWAKRKRFVCTNCIFDVDIRLSCLNNTYKKYKYSNTKKTALKYARLIKDFKINQSLERSETVTQTKLNFNFNRRLHA